MNKEELRRYCEREVADYKYDLPESAVGNPWSADKVEAQLRECKAAIVEPYNLQIELRDTLEQMKEEPAIVCEVMIVADDREGYKVFYNPNSREFGLAQYKTGDDTVIPLSINVYGDFVGTFMAR